MTNTALAARLECELVVVATNSELRLSAVMRKQVLDAYEGWILTNPSLHNPFKLLKNGPLSLVRTMLILNHVLGTMYDMRFQREGKKKMTKGKFEFMYEARESEDFPRVNADFSFHKTKPSVKLWASAPLPDLSEGDLLQVGARYMQLGAGFSARQNGEHGCTTLPHIRPDMMYPCAKRPRVG